MEDTVILNLTLPEKLLEKLRRVAELRGGTVDEVVGEMLLKYLGINDPDTRAEFYLKLYERYLKEAGEFLKKGDYAQASEKAWGAAAEIVKALAAKEGRELGTHADLWNYVNEVAKRTNDPELRLLWAAANALHRNFYEVHLAQEYVEQYIEGVARFIEKLRKILNH